MGLPFELVEGYIERFEGVFPWNSLTTDSIKANIHNLELTFQAKQRKDAGKNSSKLPQITLISSAHSV